MKICAAQIKPIKGDIDQNLEIHKQWIGLAVAEGANLIVFPELSLTGYEPKLAKQLATTQDDPGLDDIQTMSDRHNITIGVGMPTRSGAEILISMILFQPHQSRQTYSKQLLHTDELPYFGRGQQQTILIVEEKKIAPAICYESLQPDHAEQAFQSGVDIYLASVAKSANGVAKAFNHYPAIAKKYSMVVLMANCVGSCDDFESMGQSAVWNKDGSLLGQLNDQDAGMLLYDMTTEEVVVL